METTTDISIGVRRTIRESLQKALSRFHASLPLDSRISQLVIKPSIYDPSLPGNTSAELIRAILKVFADFPTVFIVESDTHVRSAESAFAYLGLDNNRVHFVNLSKAPRRSYSFSDPHLDGLELSAVVDETSLLVNLATPKVNPATETYSGAIKNLFGLLPTESKKVYHEMLDDVLLELLKVYRTTLVILELGDVVIGDRQNGQTSHIGGVIVGTDPVAVDAFCASIFGLEPHSIPILRRAYELGLGEILPERIHVLGTKHQISELIRRCRLAV